MQQHTTALRAASLALSAALILTGCISGPTEPDANDPNNSLVFGYLDMSDAPTDLDWVQLKQVAPPGQEGIWGLGVEDGLVYYERIPPGSYQMAQFGGSGMMAGDVRYNFPSYGKNETALRVTKAGGIYYLGSYKYVKVKTGMFEAGKFDIQRVNSPGERELLERLLKLKGIKGTPWVARINARLAGLPAGKKK